MPQKSFLEILIEISPYVGVASLCGMYAAIRRGWKGWRDMLLSIAGSAICGGIVGWWCMGSGLNTYLVGSLCGIAGLMGDRGLQALTKAVFKKIEKADKEPDKE